MHRQLTADDITHAAQALAMSCHAPMSSSSIQLKLIMIAAGVRNPVDVGVKIALQSQQELACGRVPPM